MTNAQLQPSVAVVTPTRNRVDLLKCLYESLVLQNDQYFTWVVIDDESSDGTLEWLQLLQAPFPVVALRSEQNIGKCAALNIAFDAGSYDLYMIVDSDDWLLPSAVSVARSTYSTSKDHTDIGAFFFVYQDRDGKPLGQPPNGKSVIMTRAEMDAKHGKYDGCVVYTKSVVDRFRYPSFAAETYLAPTLLQLQMSPPFTMLFSNEAVGVAEYQADGITNHGRALRLKNPRGMMRYAKVNAEKGASARRRFRYRILYWAYASALTTALTSDEKSDLMPPIGTNRLEKLAGSFLGRRWQGES